VPRVRIDEVAASIRGVLTGETTVEWLFRKGRRFSARRRPAPTSNLPMRVAVDNETSDHCTILDVFAHDRAGLLYTITRTLYELELSVVLARIATNLDQVVDVFYVTDPHGKKIHDRDRLHSIRTALAARIEEFEREGHLEFAC
jgi:[protein-PII] uridylyltransferase